MWIQTSLGPTAPQAPFIPFLWLLSAEHLLPLSPAQSQEPKANIYALDLLDDAILSQITASIIQPFNHPEMCRNKQISFDRRELGFRGSRGGFS